MKLKIIEAIKKLFHTHEIVWTSREVVANLDIDFTTNAGFMDIQPGLRYLQKGHCIVCGKPVTKIYDIAKMFDKEQPFDKKE